MVPKPGIFLKFDWYGTTCCSLRSPVPVGGDRMRKVESAVKSLLDLGRSQGHLSFAQVSEVLQNSPKNSELLDQILEALELAGIEVIDPEE